MKTVSRALTSDDIGISSRRRMPFRSSYFSCLLFLTVIFVWAAAFDSLAFGAKPASSPAASAASIIGKDAKLNGTPMPAGATLFPGDVIVLGEDSTAALRFADGLVLAAPETELVVESEGVSLRDGRLQARASGEKFFSVSGPFFHVSIAASGGIPRSAEIRLGGRARKFLLLSGQVANVTAGNNLRISRSGAFAGPSPASTQEAQAAKDLTDILGKTNQSPVLAGTRPVVVILTGTEAAVGIGGWQGRRPPVSTAIP